MTKNTESRARAQCALDLQSAIRRPEDIVAAVERYWPVVAREIEAGIRDDDLPPLEDLDRLTEEYRRLIG